MDRSIRLEIVTRLAEQKSNLGEAAGTRTGIWELPAVMLELLRSSVHTEFERTCKIVFGFSFFLPLAYRRRILQRGGASLVLVEKHHKYARVFLRTILKKPELKAKSFPQKRPRSRNQSDVSMVTFRGGVHIITSLIMAVWWGVEGVRLWTANCLNMAVWKTLSLFSPDSVCQE